LQHRRDGTSTGPFASCSCCDSLYEHASIKLAESPKGEIISRIGGVQGSSSEPSSVVALHLQRLSNQLVQQRRLSRL
jgi:hypothetical protein